MEDEVKSKVLRPLAGKFVETFEKVQKGEYKPASVEEAQTLTESFIDQAWQRLKPYLKDKVYTVKKDEQ